MHLVCPVCATLNRVPEQRLGDAPVCGKCGENLLDEAPRALDVAGFERLTERHELPVLVDFWAPWCGPCRTMAPEFARAAASLAPTARLAKINTEDYPEVSGRLGIRGIPLLILYHRGREVARLAGARPAAEIAAFVRQSLPQAV